MYSFKLRTKCTSLWYELWLWPNGINQKIRTMVELVGHHMVFHFISTRSTIFDESSPLHFLSFLEWIFIIFSSLFP